MARWTLTEMDYLKENYNSENVLKIMKRLNKTYYSIKRKAQEMGLERDIFQGGLYFSTMDVKDILGCAKSTLRYYVDNKLIKVIKFRSFDKEYNKFTVESIIKFMCNYPERWIHRPYDEDTIKLLFIDFRGPREYIEKVRWLMGNKDKIPKITNHGKKKSKEEGKSVKETIRII